MKTLYFDCFSGISGDMILGALVDLGFDLDKELRKLRLSSYKLDIKKVQKHCLTGTKVNVIIPHEETHSKRLGEIYRIIDRSRLDKDVKKKCKEIFLRLAKAESKAHYRPAKEVELHELGDLDAIIDICGVVSGIKKLGIERICASALSVGSGFVRCRHGLLPVPAPATVELLKGVPYYSDGTRKELTTPTGAALISTFAEQFGSIPEMTVSRVGYGAGYADLKHPNILRVFLGESEPPVSGTADSVDVLEANIDDMNPEYYDFVMKKLFDEGALDVFFSDIHMKKNRTGIKLSVISELKKTPRLIDTIFRETTTFGVRCYRTKREILAREQKTVKTKYGAITVKIGKRNNKMITVSPEYESCKKSAEANKIPLRTVYEEVIRRSSKS